MTRPRTPRRKAQTTANRIFLLTQTLRKPSVAMIEEFSRETDRGADTDCRPLVATNLGQVITDLSPKAFKKNSTFSARAKIAYESGFINDTAHCSINHLRQLRNKAAHSQESFSLLEHRPTLRAMCDLGSDTASAVNLFARDTIMKSFIGSLMARGCRA